MFSREFDKLQDKLNERINYMKTLNVANPLSMRSTLEDMSNIIDDMMHEVDKFMGPNEDDRDYENWRDRMDNEAYERYREARDYESGI